MLIGIPIGSVLSNGGSPPTWDETLGLFNVQWFNASIGVNAPNYYQNGELFSGGVTDHGDLTGLGDDDHSLYLLQDGSEGLTGNWDIGEYDLTGKYIYADEFYKTGIGNYTAWIEGLEGGGVTDHGDLTGLEDDDHSLYLLQDGSEGLTGDWDVGDHGVNATWMDAEDFYIDGVNISDLWGGGSGGVVNFTRETVDYVVYYNSTSSTYNAQSGTTGEIDYSYSNPTSTIEAVWSALSNGGSFRTIGSDEVWTVSSTIDSQSNFVEWISDLSLTFQLDTDVDDHVIVVAHNDTILRGLNIDGNAANQSPIPAGTHLCGITLDSVWNIKIEDCYFYDCYESAIITNYPNQADSQNRGSHYVKILNNRFEDNWANGITVGASEFIETSLNFFSGHSDIALQVGWNSSFITVDSNIVVYTLSNNSPWGLNTHAAISCEQYTRNATITNNVIMYYKTGIDVVSNSHHIIIDGNDCYYAIGTDSAHIWVGSTGHDVIISNNMLTDAPDGSTYQSIISKGYNIMIEGNYIEYYTQSGMAIQGHNVTINDCTIKDDGTGSHAISLWDVSDFSITNVRISWTGGRGINVDMGTPQENGKISDCVISHTVSEGIYCRGTSYVSISNNNLRFTGGDAIYVYKLDKSTISLNLIISPGGEGIELGYQTDTTTVGLNNINLATGECILLASEVTFCYLFGNQLSDGSAYAIMIDGNSDNNTLRDNWTLGCASGSVRINNANCEFNFIWMNTLDAEISDAGTTNIYFDNINQSVGGWLASANAPTGGR